MGIIVSCLVIIFVARILYSWQLSYLISTRWENVKSFIKSKSSFFPFFIRVFIVKIFKVIDKYYLNSLKSLVWLLWLSITMLTVSVVLSLWSMVVNGIIPVEDIGSLCDATLQRVSNGAQHCKLGAYSIFSNYHKKHELFNLLILGIMLRKVSTEIYFLNRSIITKFSLFILFSCLIVLIQTTIYGAINVKGGVFKVLFHFHAVVINVMMITMITFVFTVVIIIIKEYNGKWAVIHYMRDRLIWIDGDIFRISSAIVIFCSCFIFIQGVAYIHTNFIPGDMGVFADIVSPQPEVKCFTVF